MAHAEKLGIARLGTDGGKTGPSTILADGFGWHDDQRFFGKALFNRRKVAFDKADIFEPRVVFWCGPSGLIYSSQGFKFCEFVLLGPFPRSNTLPVGKCDSGAPTASCGGRCWQQARPWHLQALRWLLRGLG